MKKPVSKPAKNPLLGKNGYDLMAGPEIKTIPGPCKPQYVPGLGLNMGMDRPRP